MVDDTVDGKDNMEEKTSEVADIRRDMLLWWCTTGKVFCWFLKHYDNIKDMQVDGCQHGGLWGQQAREDQGIRWRQDVSLLLKFFI